VITLVLGGARSGKSEVAEQLVERRVTGRVRYLATASLDGLDDDLAARVQVHRDRRGGRYETVEAADDLAGCLARSGDQAVLIDALGPWLAGRLHAGDDPTRAGRQLVDALVARSAPSVDTVVVSDEVGLSVHPETTVGRDFRDALGLVNQQVAAVSDQVLLVVAGRVLALPRLDQLDHPDLLGPTP
jgi:adenosyl cobinamide kinase/adenosyl cobinamide phosphate guanylyltransferase